VRMRHNPIVTHRADGRWVVECRECSDSTSSVPIGIGIPLSDQITAQRVAENHRGPVVTGRQVAEPRTEEAPDAR
jgi:hypothetical protein